MFTKPLSYITLPSDLKQAYEEISKLSSGLDEVSYREFEKDLNHNISELNYQKAN